MKITKRQLKRIIKEEKAKILNEQPRERSIATAMGHTGVQPGQEAMAISYKLEELEEALAAAASAEDWAERYPRSLQGFLDNVDRIIVVLDKMS